MYENIINLLNEPLGLKLLQEQKIDIFDLASDFYNDICFHYESLNGKDATLQDRIKTFYPNVVLCNKGCKSKGIDLTKLEIECECSFHDLLSKDIFQNDLIGNNVLIKETLKDLTDIISNLNLEVLACYKDVFDFKYIKKNIGGFIIIAFFMVQTFYFIHYYTVCNDKILRHVYSLIEAYILSKKKKDKKNVLKQKINFPPKKRNLFTESPKIHNRNKTKINKIKLKKNKIKKNSSQLSLINNKNKCIKENTSKLNSTKNELKKSIISGNIIDENIDLTKYIEPTFEDMDYDDVIDYDKRGFGEYFGEKLTENHMIINCFCIKEIIRSRPIKIAIFILTIELYFLINGLFYSDSYISEVFNSTEEETLFRFVSRSYDRFLYSTIVGNIIEYIIKFLLVEEIQLKKLFLKKMKDKLVLRYEMSILL